MSDTPIWDELADQWADLHDDAQPTNDEPDER